MTQLIVTLLLAGLHIATAQIQFSTVYACLRNGNFASCDQCDSASPPSGFGGACQRCEYEDRTYCVVGCPREFVTAKCDSSPPRPSPRPTPWPTPWPTPTLPTTTQQVVVYTQSPTPPPTPYPQQPTPRATTTTASTTASSTTTNLFIDFSTTTTTDSTTASTLATASSTASASLSADSAQQFFTNAAADATGPLSLDAWVGIACAAVILCSCCLTFCVVCAVRRKRRRDAERNDALAYYQNAARPAPPSLPSFSAPTSASFSAQPTGIVAKRALMIQPPPSSGWSSSSLPSMAPSDNFTRFPYSTAAPPGYESPTSALPNPYASQASRYIDAAAPFQTMVAPAGYEMPPQNLKGDF